MNIDIHRRVWYTTTSMIFNHTNNIVYFKVNFSREENQMIDKDEDEDWGDDEELNDWDSFQEELDDDWDDEDELDEDDMEDDVDPSSYDEDDEEEDDIDDDADYEYRDDSEDDE